MKNNSPLKKFFDFLKKDSWSSWIVSMVLLIILIRFIIFPVLSIITASSLPLVVVESCSMYHQSDFDSWWKSRTTNVAGSKENWYEQHEITKSKFSDFKLKNGLNKGDIIIVWNRGKKKLGDIIIFDASQGSTAKNPIIHRIVSENPLETKGDNNMEQLTRKNNYQKIDETKISEDKVIGKSVARIPLLGWIKLIFFEPGRPANQRGFCK